MRIIVLLILFLGQAIPGWAAETAAPMPGVRYRISGVAQSDRLNVRDQPGIHGRTVGTFAPSASGIIVTGLRQEGNGSDWWEVVYPHAQGKIVWVNSHFLTPQASNGAEETNYPLLCTGTEPFWDLQIQAGWARYSLAGSHDRTFNASSWLSARGLLGQFVVRLTDEDNTGQNGYAVMVRNASCSDNMSDRLYPFNGVLILPEGEVLAGCCRRAAPQSLGK
jgi:uncharacterized membrane protein